MSCRRLESDIRTTFGVELTPTQSTALETVGQLHDIVRAAFADRLENEPEVLARFCALAAVRRAIRGATHDETMVIDYRSRVADLLPHGERISCWAELNKEMGGTLPKLELPERTQSLTGWGCVSLVVFTPPAVAVLSLLLNHFFRITTPTVVLFWAINCLLYWIVVHTVLGPRGTEIPNEVHQIANLAEHWIALVQHREPHLPTGERELWYLYRKIVSDVSGHDPRRISRETRFADLGIE